MTAVLKLLVTKKFLQKKEKKSMARSKLKISSGGGAVTAGRRVTLNPKVARRSFLKLSAATAALTGVAMTTRMTTKANAAAGQSEPYVGSEKVKTICTYCAVGCGIEAEVHNGVWVRQEIAADHPVSFGASLLQGRRGN